MPLGKRCTCDYPGHGDRSDVGVCRGAEGLGDGWYCAQGQPANPPTPDPDAALTGRLNRIIADTLGVEDSRVLPGARLVDISPDWRCLIQLEDTIEAELSPSGLAGWVDKCLTVGDLHDFVAARVAGGVAR